MASFLRKKAAETLKQRTAQVASNTLFTCNDDATWSKRDGLRGLVRENLRNGRRVCDGQAVNSGRCGT